ncbi:outer membrane beta-barrel protein [Bacteroides sp.]|uniref:outer membrane beta-barrel protein n=1 Tax=Bacteroides sp. TaxID=29523 RepID=UPI003AB86006
MKYIQTLFFLLCLGGITTSVFAQKRNYILYKDTVTGKDTVIMNVSFANKDYKKKQYAVSIVNGENKIIHTYKAEDIAGYKEGHILYVSRNLSVDGEVRRVLLPRVYRNDDISIYSFIQDDGRKEYYAQMPNDSLLLPLKGSPETNGANPLSAYLEQFPAVKENEYIRAYVNQLKPTINSFDNRYIVCRTGNSNYIPHFKWGVLCGAGIYHLSSGGFSFNTKGVCSAGLFADQPLLMGFSVHIELAYQQYAFNYEADDITEKSVAFNCRNISLPIALRYTAVSLRGKCLPFIHAGVQLNFSFKREIESQWKEWKDDEYCRWVYNPSQSLKKNNPSLMAGLGVEWKLRARHSLFFDIRYCRELSNSYYLEGYYATVSYNL